LVSVVRRSFWAGIAQYAENAVWITVWSVRV
jgi:hypothetical protein